MGKIDEIYNNIKDRISTALNIEIKRGTVLDLFILATSDMINEAKNEIDSSKDPHIFSNLKGNNIDDMGILFGLTRKENESDKNYLYRIIKWNTANKSSNYDAIETALMNTVYSSHITYVPKVYGCGTAAAYIIPKTLTEEYKRYAIEEAKEILDNVSSPSTYIEYIIPTVLSVKIIILYKSTSSDTNSIKRTINENIITYINNIAPGEYLKIGEINKIGIGHQNIEYFNVNNLFINSEEHGEVEILQKVETKFIIESDANIVWKEVN